MNPTPKDRHENLQVNFEEFRTGAFQLKSLPPVLFIELTQNCNLNCFMCRAAEGYSKELNMDDSIFSQIERELFPYASIVDLRGYGESTVLKNFEDRVKQTALLVPKIRLVTNALAIRNDLWKLLMEKGADVVVSVDAATKETMSNLGRGNFDKLMNSLECGSNERDKVNSRGSISFNTTVSNLNLEELKDIISIAAGFGIKRVTMFPVVIKKDNPLSLEIRKSQIATFLKEAENAAHTYNVELRLGASLDDSLVVQEGLPNRCSHPWEYCYIDYSGNVGYCDHLIGNSKQTFGNLKENKFVDIWNGKNFQRLRETHSKAKKGGTDELSLMFPHCNWCYKRRYVDFEDDINPEAKDRIISSCSCNPLINLGNIETETTQFMTGRNLPHINIVK